MILMFGAVSVSEDGIVRDRGLDGFAGRRVRCGLDHNGALELPRGGPRVSFLLGCGLFRARDEYV